VISFITRTCVALEPVPEAEHDNRVLGGQHASLDAMRTRSSIVRAQKVALHAAALVLLEGMSPSQLPLPARQSSCWFWGWAERSVRSDICGGGDQQRLRRWGRCRPSK